MRFISSLFRPRHKVPKTDISERFQLVRELGHGSMSKVWRANDLKTGKPVALKILDKEKTLRFESRFIDRVKPTEGEIAVQLLHPHIVRTYEYGRTLNDEQFLVMELVEGISLSYLVDMQNEKMKQNRLRFAIEIGDALVYFHRENWIHRDVCPRNVLLDSNYQVKLIDFGLVVPNTRAFQEPGNRTGTADYMAPELIKRQRTDQRIDVYSYAVTCYEMYTGKLPWPQAAASLEAVLRRINQPAEDIRLTAPETDQQVAETIMRGLEASPNNRWQTVAAMVDQFREARKRLEKPRRKKGRTRDKADEPPKDEMADQWQFRTT